MAPLRFAPHTRATRSFWLHEVADSKCGHIVLINTDAHPQPLLADTS